MNTLFNGTEGINIDVHKGPECTRLFGNVLGDKTSAKCYEDGLALNLGESGIVIRSTKSYICGPCTPEGMECLSIDRLELD